MILCSGCFDGVHAGHVAYLRAARIFRAKADEPIIIAVAPDAYIRRVKGHEPRWPLVDRMMVLMELGDAFTHVIAHDEQSVASVIRSFGPRVLVKGADWRGRLEPDVAAVCDSGDTRVLFVNEHPCKRSAEAWA